MAYQSNKTGNIKKDVRYLNKDFSQIRNNLIEFSKQYFPNTYQDFNESSPGMMFIEMASYVGDVMSYYIDAQFKEGKISRVIVYDKTPPPPPPTEEGSDEEAPSEE